MKSVSEKIKKSKYDRAKREQEFKPEIFLHPMADWHLRSNWKGGVNIGGRSQMVWLFGIIGTFVLLLACINFMNLSTARSEKRAKEVGIRMTIGSLRTQLISQFLSESFLVVLLAYIVAIGLVIAMLPWFNNLSDKRIAVEWANPIFWMISFAFILFTSLLAGSYPALYLSSFNPVKVLKGTFKAGRFASLPRKVLVVVQFAVSLTLIIGTIIVYQQIQFSKSRPVGYDREGLMMIQMRSPEFYGKYDLLRTELKKSGAVEEMSESSGPVTGVWSNNGGFTWPGKDPNLQEEFATIWITHEYGKTINWKIAAGRDLSRDFSTDSTGIIVNESSVKFMGLKEPIGTEVTFDDRKHHIVGVTKDMVMESPYSPVKPTIYILDANNVNWINLKLIPNKSASESLSVIKSIFKKHVPSAPFDYKFVDEEYAKKFNDEERIGKLASVFSILAIVISCFGLFGLASFVAEQRTKEIGIRKVLGASVPNLWQLLSKDFVLLILIACLISIPIAYSVLSNWLRSYDYHTEISWWTFVVCGFGAVIITLSTVSFQAIRAALMNPVKSLKSE
jgi:ABC-type antimicrobial peptide transport system permease subunit